MFGIRTALLSQTTADKRLGSCPVKSALAAAGRQGVPADVTNASLGAGGAMAGPG